MERSHNTDSQERKLFWSQRNASLRVSSRCNFVGGRYQWMPAVCYCRCHLCFNRSQIFLGFINVLPSFVLLNLLVASLLCRELPQRDEWTLNLYGRSNHRGSTAELQVAGLSHLQSGSTNCKLKTLISAAYDGQAARLWTMWLVCDPE